MFSVSRRGVINILTRFRWNIRICETSVWKWASAILESTLLSWDWCELLARDGTLYLSFTTMKGKLHFKLSAAYTFLVHCLFKRSLLSLSTRFALQSFFLSFFCERNVCYSSARNIWLRLIVRSVLGWWIVCLNCYDSWMEGSTHNLCCWPGYCVGCSVTLLHLS